MCNLNPIRAMSLTIALMVAGCGTYVPEIEDFPAGPPDGQRLVQAIVTSIHCEVAKAVKDVIDRDIEVAQQYQQELQAKWLYGWGAQVTLTLTVEERTTISPTTLLTPVSPLTSIFTLAGSLTGSADATRTDKVNFFWTVPELYKRAPCTTGVQPKAPATSLLIQSDLKLAQWLRDQIAPAATGEVTYPTAVSGPLGTNVLSHEVKFQVVSSGEITPAWKLIQVNFNQSGTLLSTTRDRTHDLTITFGPAEAKGLSPAASNAHLAAQIGLAVSTNLRPALQ